MTERHPPLADHLRATGADGPGGRRGLAVVLEALAAAGARLADELARAPLTGRLGETGEVNPHGDRVRRLDLLANDLFLEALRATGQVTVVASEELPRPVAWPAAPPGTGFAVCLDPLDGSLNTDVAGPLGSIFGIRPGPERGDDPAVAVLGPGTRQLAAGYVLYGPATVFVYAAGGAVHVFARDPATGAFHLARPDVRMPPRGPTYAVNDANWPRWGPAPRALVEWLRAATDAGRRSLRYSGALVADFHRVLLEGGIYLYPADAERPTGRIRLLYEAAPLAMVAEAAGGRASAGRGRVLEVAARDPHQRTPLYLGSAGDVEQAERFHRETGA